MLLPAYVAILLAFAALDLLWLGVFAKDLYRRHIGHLMAAEVRWPPAMVFYLIYAAGIIFFAVRPGIEAESLKKTALNGAAIGLMVYASYDLTNLALLKGWTTEISIIDIIWGTFATGTAASVGYLASRLKF